MSVLVRASTSPASISSGATIAVPGTPAAGDIMLALFSSPSGTPFERGVMGGWHKYNQALLFDARYFILYYRISAGSEPATYTTNFDSTMTGAMLVVYSDASAHTKFDALATDIRATSTSLIWPTVTLTAAGLLLNFGVVDSSFSVTPPGGSTGQWDGPSFTSGRLELFTESRSSGATGTRTATASNTESSELLSLAIIDAVFVYPFSPVFRDRTLAGQATGTSKTIAAPSTLKVGDTMILHVGFLTASPTFTVSGTWTAVPGGEITGSNSIHTFSRVAEAGDIGATYTISWSGSKTINAALTCYYSPSGYALAVGVITSQTNAAAVNIPFPSLTTTHTDSLVLWLASLDNVTSPTWDASAPKGIGQYANGTNINLHGFSEYVAATGATGARTATIGGATTNSKVIAIALAEVVTPLPPTGLAATAVSPSQINLAWSDVATDELGYKVYHSTTGSGFTLLDTIAANSVSYNHTGLAEYSVHYYYVAAYNNDGESTASNTSNARTGIIAPTALAAVAVLSTVINLSWQDNSGVESGTSIERSPNGSTSWSEIATVGAGVHVYSNTGLTPSTPYYYRVRAYVT